MANETRHKPDQVRDLARDQGSHRPVHHERHEPGFNPFSLMRQGIDEMDRLFSRMIGSSGPEPGSHWFSPGRSGWMSSTVGRMGDWMPAVEAFQRGHEFIVRVDAPGMKRNELSVEAGDDSITIRGERKQEQRDEQDGLFWSERSYGSFSRTVPVPPGTITDSAKATFNNGVLEIVMQAPPQEARRGRKIDISGQ